jgi:exodeoxyribonuclease VII large subunit
MEMRAERLAGLVARATPAVSRYLTRSGERLANLDKLRLTLDPDRPLSRGFARVHLASGALARSATALTPGEALRLVFHDGDRAATVDGAAPAGGLRRRKPATADQGQLF